MTPMRLLTLGLVAAALAASAGCKKPEEAPGKTAPPSADADAAPADAAAPYSFAQKNNAAEVSLKLPAEMGRQPDLHARIYSEGVASLRQFAEGAANERAEMGEEDGGPTQPYERTIEWYVGADTGKLFSVWSLQSESTGGAHGNSSFNAVLWDKALQRQIQPGQLFEAGVDEAMNKALCDALTAAKKARLADTYQAPSADTWTCPKWRETVFTLVPSGTPGKAGGLVFLIPPYAAGAYAEGDFRVVVPASAFRAHLKAAYADEFAGSPVVPKILSAQP